MSSSHAEPASLFAATPSVVATRIALVLGLARDGNGRGGRFWSFFTRCWRNISLSRRQLSTGNQVVKDKEILVR